MGCILESVLTEAVDLENEMTAIIKAISRCLLPTSEVDILTEIALFCGAGLLVSVLLLGYGVDLSPGFF